MNRRNVFALSCAALSLAATSSFAQFSRRGRGDAAKGKSAAGESVNTLEVTLHEFYEDLKLSAAQEPLWNAYADKVRALESDVARERRQVTQMALPQRIDRTVDVARDRLTAVEDVALAAKALYARLTPEQQETADPRLANIILLPFAGAVPGVERAPRSRGPVSN